VVLRKFSFFLGISLILLLLGILVGCGTYGRVIVEDERGSVIVDVDKGPGHVYCENASLKIPPGHMPPSGKCRIWLPDRPPGQQPPPGNCWDLERRVPPGAWLIKG
jgi:hypothetical protein